MLILPASLQEEQLWYNFGLKAPCWDFWVSDFSGRQTPEASLLLVLCTSPSTPSHAWRQSPAPCFAVPL